MSEIPRKTIGVTVRVAGVARDAPAAREVRAGEEIAPSEAEVGLRGWVQLHLTRCGRTRVERHYGERIPEEVCDPDLPRARPQRQRARVGADRDAPVTEPGNQRGQLPPVSGRESDLMRPAEGDDQRPAILGRHCG